AAQAGRVNIGGVVKPQSYRCCHNSVQIKNAAKLYPALLLGKKVQRGRSFSYENPDFGTKPAKIGTNSE
ncbi:MAG: hypothetical protein KIG45_04515, partial [Bacteroidales bacterium]|nr:hypothetical protein [Bacteroidales bacterium]